MKVDANVDAKVEADGSDGSGDGNAKEGRELNIRIKNNLEDLALLLPEFKGLGGDQDMYVVQHTAKAILDFYTAKIKLMYNDEEVIPEISNLVVAFKTCIKEFINGNKKNNLRFMLQPITQYTAYSHKLLLETIIEDHINNMLEMYFTCIKDLDLRPSINGAVLEANKKILVTMSNLTVIKYTSMLEHLIAVVRDPGNITMKNKIRKIYEDARVKAKCPAIFNFDHLIKVPYRNPPFDEKMIEEWKKMFEEVEQKGKAKQAINFHNEKKKKETIDVIKKVLEKNYTSEFPETPEVKIEDDGGSFKPDPSLIKNDVEEELIDYSDSDDDNEEESDEEGTQGDEEGTQGDEEGTQGDEEGTEADGTEADEEGTQADGEGTEGDGDKTVSRVDKLNAAAESDDTEEEGDGEGEKTTGGKSNKTPKTYKKVKKSKKCKNKTIKIKCI